MINLKDGAELRLTDRDIKDILEKVNIFQCMTTVQIAKVNEMHIKVCQRRLRKLLKEDYLRKVLIPTTKGRSPYLLYLGSKGEALLNTRSSKPRLTLQLTHQQKNTDILIDIINSFKSTGIKCGVLPEHLIRIAEQEIIPDGTFMLERNNKSILLLIENCSGTEIIKSPSFNQDIETKIIRYEEMFVDNNVRYYEDYFKRNLRRFRLLYLTNDTSRQSSISSLIKDHDIHGFVYISTLSEFKQKGITANIWNIPAVNKFNQSII